MFWVPIITKFTKKRNLILWMLLLLNWASCSPIETESQCSSYTTCSYCHDDPACGWCDDGLGTGLGTCMTGGYQGPNLHNQSLTSNTCPSGQWNFTRCPSYYSTETDENYTYKESCALNTVGLNCERCRDGFWGNPVDGGCRPCECNGHASKCHHETGKCFCTTKGVIGDHCEMCDHCKICDTSNRSLIGKESCFYDLTIDNQFIFNLSKKEDRHYTQINFRNSPPKPEIDTDFTLYCAVPAKFNITVKTANNPEERAILTGHKCSSFRGRFKKADYNFSIKDNISQTTFFVYIYDFQLPLWIQASFSQFTKNDK